MAHVGGALMLLTLLFNTGFSLLNSRTASGAAIQLQSISASQGTMSFEMPAEHPCSKVPANKKQKSGKEELSRSVAESQTSPFALVLEDHPDTLLFMLNHSIGRKGLAPGLLIAGIICIAFIVLLAAGMMSLSSQTNTQGLVAGVVALVIGRISGTSARQANSPAAPQPPSSPPQYSETKSAGCDFTTAATKQADKSCDMYCSRVENSETMNTNLA